MSIFQVTNNGNIYVIWPDDHKSVFDYDWLKKRKFTRDDIHKRLSYMSRPTRVWNADLQNKIPKFDYNEVITTVKNNYKNNANTTCRILKKRNYKNLDPA